jgi:hypothetical protein
LPPFVTSTWLGSTTRPLSRRVFSAMASLSSGSPPAGEYRCIRGSWQAFSAAITMWSGVGKSGSPAPNPITSCPAARIAFAVVSTVRVADGAMPPMRCEIRLMAAMLPRVPP